MRDLSIFRFYVALFAFWVLLCACRYSSGTQVTLTWDPPTLDTEGTPLTDLAGFRLHYGTESGSYSRTIDTGLANSHCLTNLHPHTRYYFAVTAIDKLGRESKPSNELTWAYDGDSDDMADMWENRYLSTGGLPDLEPEQDEDGDGASNLSEFVAGTNPIDPSSFAAVQIEALPAARAFRVSFHALSASGVEYSGFTRHYALEECKSLLSGEWRPVAEHADVIGADQPVEYFTTAMDESLYFRTRVWLE